MSFGFHKIWICPSWAPIKWQVLQVKELPWWFSGKESACQCRRHEFSPGLGRCPGEGNGNPLSMDRGVWQITVHQVAKSQIVLSNWSTTTTHTWCVCSVMLDSLLLCVVYPTRLLCPWDSPRQEYWSGFPFPPPGDLPDPGTKPESPASPTLAGGFILPLSHLGRPHRHRDEWMILPSWSALYWQRLRMSPGMISLPGKIFAGYSIHPTMEEGMATHSSILAWGIPWTEEPGRLQSIRSQRIGHNWSYLAQHIHPVNRTYWAFQDEKAGKDSAVKELITNQSTPKKNSFLE